MTHHRHRYHQAALNVPSSATKDYSPTELQLAKPAQGWLNLDGAVLGPLFDAPAPAAGPAVPATTESEYWDLDYELGY